MDGSRKRRQEELADALDQLRGFICMDTDFVAVDINGAQHADSANLLNCRSEGVQRQGMP